MNNIHPDWVLTDTNTTAPQHSPKAIEKKDSEYIPIAGLDVSRRPAAIVGILLVVGTGIGFLFGTQSLTGQLAQEVDVTITNEGMIPKQITVQRGMSIRWKNEQDIPHVIKSNTLCDTGNVCLQTETIFTGESKSAVISSGIEIGTYTYYSGTKDTLDGVIIVTDSEPATVQSKGFTDFIYGGDLDALVEDIAEEKKPAAQEVLQVEEENVADVPPTPKTEDLPNNPNTVDSKKTNPIETIEKLHAEKEENHSAAASVTGKGKSFSQPETGPGMWIAIIIGVVSGFLVIRKSKKNLCITKRIMTKICNIQH